MSSVFGLSWMTVSLELQAIIQWEPGAKGVLQHPEPPPPTPLLATMVIPADVPHSLCDQFGV